MNLTKVYSHLSEFRISEKIIHNVYLRGSRAIGTNGIRFDGSPSDWDFVIVIKSPYSGNNYKSIMHFQIENSDYTIYELSLFKELVRKNSIWALECIFGGPTNIWREIYDPKNIFSLNPIELKRSVFFEVEHKIVKARRRAKDDIYVTIKSFFIAIRYLYFAVEVYKSGRIDNLKGVNYIWQEAIKFKEKLTNFEDVRKFYDPYFTIILEKFLYMCPRLIYKNIDESKKINWDIEISHVGDLTTKFSTFVDSRDIILIKNMVFAKEMMMKLCFFFELKKKKVWFRKEIKHEALRDIVEMVFDGFVLQNYGKIAAANFKQSRRRSRSPSENEIMELEEEENKHIFK